MATIDFMKFRFRGPGGTGHPSQMFETEKEILNRDSTGLPRRDGNFNPFFGFDRLMNAVAPFSAFSQTAGKLVDNHDFAVPNDILLIKFIFTVDFNGALYIFVDVEKAGRCHLVRFRKLSCFQTSFSRQFDRLLFVVVFVVFVFDELIDFVGRPLERRHFLLLLFGRQGADNQRRTRLVD